jgi:hypothetical protein
MAVSKHSRDGGVNAELIISRGLVTGMISAPFIINNFISAEIAQSVLPNW